MKSFSGRNNFLEQAVFGITNSLLYKNIELLGFDLSLKTCTLKRFLLNAQNNFYFEFIWRRACDKKNQVWNLCLWLVSKPQKSGCFFFFGGGEIYCGASFEIILKSPVFGFCDSLPYGLEKSKELRPLISWLLGL